MQPMRRNHGEGSAVGAYILIHEHWPLIPSRGDDPLLYSPSGK